MLATASRHLLAAAVASVVLAPSAVAAPGDAIVLDNGGVLHAVNPVSGAVSVISDNGRSLANGGQARFVNDEFAVARNPDGSYAVISRRDPGAGGSRVTRVNAATGAQSVISDSPQFTYGLNAVATDAAGQIYVGDEFAPESNPDAPVAGSIYRVNPADGATTLITNNSMSQAAGGIRYLDGPMGLIVDPAGTLWALDDIAGDESGPDPDNDQQGSVLSVDQTTGRMTVFTSNSRSAQAGGASLFTDPRAFARDAAGNFYVVDNPTVGGNPIYGPADIQIIRVDHATGAQTLVSDNARSVTAGGPGLLTSSYGIAVEPNGQLLVADGERLLRVDPATGRQSVVAQGLGHALALTLEPGTPAGGGGGTPVTPPTTPPTTPPRPPSTPTRPSTPPVATVVKQVKTVLGTFVAKTREAQGRRVPLGRIAADALPGGTAISLKLGRLASARIVAVPGRSTAVTLKLKTAGVKALRRKKKVSATLTAIVSVPGLADVTAKRTLRVKKG